VSSVSAATSDSLASGLSTSPSGDQLEHIDILLHSLPLDLTPDQQEHAETFIRSYANIFSKWEYDIGRTNIIPHPIDTGDSSPHFEQLCHHPTAQLLVIDEHVQHMLEHDVIEPATSPWCSNVVIVQKQDGTMWLCIDYRKLNSLTVKDKFPLPKIDTCLDTLNGYEFFSTCDLCWGYWQTETVERKLNDTNYVLRKGKGKAVVVHVDRIRKLPKLSDSESVDSHTHTQYTEPTTKSCKRCRSANATDSMTDTHCMSTANCTDKTARFLPLVKSRDTDADSNSANVCTSVDLDIGMDKVVIVNPLEMSSQSAHATADREAVATRSTTKPLPLLATRPQRHRRHQ